MKYKNGRWAFYLMWPDVEMVKMAEQTFSNLDTVACILWALFPPTAEMLGKTYWVLKTR